MRREKVFFRFLINIIFRFIIRYFNFFFLFSCKVVFFWCYWVDIRLLRGGFKVDKFGYFFVNFSRLIYIGKDLKDDLFVL